VTVFRRTALERFPKSSETDRRQKGGVGLGLAVVKQIVEAHGGQVQATSKAGEGSRVDIYLPGNLRAEKIA
jgi:signal transduction histidine kinase